jgi:hypothetical protein
MNSLSKYFALSLVFGFGCVAFHAQEAISTRDQSASVPPSKSSPSLTADGVPSCSEEMKFRSLPEGVYRVGGDVLPPVPTKTPEATFSDEGRKYARSVMKTQHIKKFEAKSLLGYGGHEWAPAEYLCA